MPQRPALVIDPVMPGTTGLPDRAALRHLSAYGFDIEVQPGAGGRVVSLKYKGQDVLQPDARPDDMKLLDAGCFPLVPFSNRIRDGKFVHESHPYTLESNWDGDQHAIHGEGWTSPWSITHQDDRSIRLWMSGKGWWPWAYECSQVIRVKPNGILLSLHVTNLDTEAMPAGLGFHPYFPCHADTQLQFAASGIVPPMSEQPADIFPITPERDFSGLRGVHTRNLDHCYAGWNGIAIIRQPSTSLEITLRTSHKTAAAVVYVSPDAPFFCFEPVTHLSGAFEMRPRVKTGLEQLKPGQSLEFSVEIGVKKLEKR